MKHPYNRRLNSAICFRGFKLLRMPYFRILNIMTARKGVTTVQATIMLVIIVIGAIAFVYAWFSGVLSSVMKMGIYTPPTADWCSDVCQLSSTQPTRSTMAGMAEKREILLEMDRPSGRIYYFNATPGFIPEIRVEPETNPYAIVTRGEYSRVFVTPVVFSEFPISFNTTWANTADNLDNFTYKMTIYIKREDVPDIGFQEILMVSLTSAIAASLVLRKR